ncbi:hypothetical protein [Streptomyces sp. NPDC000878]
MQRTTLPRMTATAPTGRLPFAVQAAAVSDRVDQPATVSKWTALGADTPQEAAFSVALDAIAAVFAVSTDPDGDWQALRNAVSLYAHRDAITGEKWAPRP